MGFSHAWPGVLIIWMHWNSSHKQICFVNRHLSRRCLAELCDIKESHITYASSRVMHVLLTSRVILHMRSQSRKPQWPSQPIRGVAVYVSQEQIISRSVDDDEVELLPLSEARRVQSVDV
ncbi:hypothetical protein D9757_003082 [Collybiopsis confluens]|uniref:Uncharacterized protein n=1 Tax=Collybiopsis confluens TaxID=2823264 RepID=A0A8H5HXB9_9AGAR|nr:hypothetical protein D9757_003082 [Collybiopsis confluens]